MQTNFDRWRTLPSDERWLLVGLVVLLPAVGIAFRVLGVRRTCRIFGGRASPLSTTSEIGDHDRTTAVRLNRLVGIAARRGPYAATCLPQSVALGWLLARRGIPAEVRVGVRKQNDQLEAHAWVELADKVVNDHSAIDGEFAVFREFGSRLARTR